MHQQQQQQKKETYTEVQLKYHYPEQNLFILCINKDFIFVCIDNMITITNHIIHYSTPKTSKTFTNTTKTYKEALEVTKSTASS